MGLASILGIRGGLFFFLWKEQQREGGEFSTIPSSGRNAEKKQLIRNIQDYWNGQEKLRIKNVAETFGIAPSWLKSISAFANGTGGTLIFGIADDDTVTGIEDLKSASEFVSQEIKERIDSFPEVTMQIHSMEDGKTCLR